MRQERIELPTLGLWDLRAASCATAALHDVNSMCTIYNVCPMRAFQFCSRAVRFSWFITIIAQHAAPHWTPIATTHNTQQQKHKWSKAHGTNAFYCASLCFLMFLRLRSYSGLGFWWFSLVPLSVCWFSFVFFMLSVVYLWWCLPRPPWHPSDTCTASNTSNTSDTSNARSGWRFTAC